MSALAADRNTPRREGEEFIYGVAGSSPIIYAGALVAFNAGGYIVPGGASTTLVAAGCAQERVDNSGGGDGDLKVTVRKGIFRFANSSAGDAIALSEIGDVCYIADDQTVAKTDGTGTRSVAGTVVDVDALGVWVRFD